MADNISIPAGFVPESSPAPETAATPDMSQPEQQATSAPIPEGFEVEPTSPSVHEDNDALKAGVEGFSRGVLGPLATAVEPRLFGVSPKKMLQRHEEHGIAAGVGEGLGLLGSTIAGQGFANVMGKAGEAAAGLTKTGQAMNLEREAVLAAGKGYKEAADAAEKIFDAAPYVERVGTKVVQDLAEMAVLGGSDEISKRILNDPEQTATNAVANIGLSAALGGVGGAFITGAVSPLWKATIGKPIEEWLSSLTARANERAAASAKGRVRYDFAGTTAKDIIKDEETPAITDIIRPAKRVPLPEGVDPITAPHFLASAENPKFPKLKTIDMDTDQVIEHLKKAGFDAERAKGVYAANSEPSIMVKNVTNPEDRKQLFQLFSRLGQETALSSDGLNHEMVFLNGAERGMSVPGKGTRVFQPGQAVGSSYLTVLPSGQTFEHNLDWAAKSPLKNFENLTGIEAGRKFNPNIRAVAENYARENGLKPLDHTTPKRVPHPDRAKAIASLFEAMKDTPNDPHVKKSYKALADETMKQWQAIKETGLKVERIKPGMENPYKNANSMIKDVTENNHMWFFPSSSGFGEAAGGGSTHPLRVPSGELLDGEPLEANDLFRIVHDYFGHAKEGFGFGPEGEENAWVHHSQMYSPLARKALTTETRGQNSWVNFGPKAAHNRMASPEDTIYAPQKAGLLPDWVQDTGLVSEIKPKTVAHKLGAEARDQAVDTGLEQAADSLGEGEEESPVARAFNHLGIQMPWAAQGALHGIPEAKMQFNILREQQHPTVINALKDIEANSAKAVADRVGVPIEDALHYSNANEGNEITSAFKKEYDAKYKPVAEALERRDELSNPLRTPDEARLDFAGDMMAKAIKDVGTDSPYYELYDHYSQRVLAKDTIGGLDKLKTELFNRAKKLGIDPNEKIALHDIRNQIAEFQEKMIDQSGVQITKREGMMTPSEIMEQRQLANAKYAHFRQVSDELADHVGAGNINGAGHLKAKLDNLSPEEIAKKFSPKGNVEAIPFMAQNFPETLAKVRQLEAKKFLSKAVESDKGEAVLDVKKLAGQTEALMKGSPEYAHFVLGNEGIKAIQAAQTIRDSIPEFKSSGSAGWMYHIFRHGPSTATGVIGTLMGHNPFSSAVMGAFAEKMGRDIPAAYRLGLLRVMSSESPVDSVAFKGMVDTFKNIYKGERKLQKTAAAVFTTNAVGAAGMAQPSREDREKLNSILEKAQKNPEYMQKMFENSKTGHYLPRHQQAMTQVASGAVQYLQTLKPVPQKTGPLDAEAPVSAMAQARYNRALDIANNPNVILKHVKEGTLLPSDIQDLNAMYPSQMQNMVQVLTNEMNKAASEGKQIPYETRMGLSLILGQPVDSTMTPGSIMAAQPLPASPQPPQNAPKKGSPSKMSSKSSSMYKTADQAAEGDRSNRD